MDQKFALGHYNTNTASLFQITKQTSPPCFKSQHKHRLFQITTQTSLLFSDHNTNTASLFQITTQTSPPFFRPQHKQSPPCFRPQHKHRLLVSDHNTNTASLFQTHNTNIASLFQTTTQNIASLFSDHNTNIASLFQIPTKTPTCLKPQQNNTDLLEITERALWPAVSSRNSNPACKLVLVGFGGWQHVTHRASGHRAQLTVGVSQSGSSETQVSCRRAGTDTDIIVHKNNARAIGTSRLLRRLSSFPGSKCEPSK